MKDGKNAAKSVPLTPLDKLFEPTIRNDEDVEDNDGTNKITEVPLEGLLPFKDHPFRLYTDEKLNELADSIKQVGLINPIIVRPSKIDDGYEIISGHNRVEACIRLGMTNIKANIRDVDDNEATILMVDSNLKQREKLLPTEKAKAYKMRMDAMKKQGERSDLTCGHDGHRLPGQKTRAIIGLPPEESIA